MATVKRKRMNISTSGKSKSRRTDNLFDWYENKEVIWDSQRKMQAVVLSETIALLKQHCQESAVAEHVAAMLTDTFDEILSDLAVHSHK